MLRFNMWIKKCLNHKPEQFKDIDRSRLLRNKNKEIVCLNKTHNTKVDYKSGEDGLSSFDPFELPDHLTQLKAYCTSTVVPRAGELEEDDNIEDTFLL